MFTIKRAAEMTGISVATLRAWERRYGVVHPQRSDGGYRLYSDGDVRALAIMNSLVNEGWSAKEAAAETLARLSNDTLTTDGPWEPGLPSPPRRAEAPDQMASARVDGYAGLPASTVFTSFTEDTEAFVDAARRLDVNAITAVLDSRFAVGRFETVVDDWLMPALQRVGEAWADGRISVAGEHLVSYAVQGRLSAAYEAASNLGSGPVVIVGLAPGAHHELGLLAFAVAARRSGFATVYVGADLPADDWVGAVTTRGAAAVVMAVPREIDIAATGVIADRLRAAYPRLVIGIGGRQQGAIGSGCVHLGHGIGSAVTELVRRVRVPA
ncbi:transcriptional regulator [Humibacillus sp. DSM 29435]|uniref:MerR family transcriptional regulator n=1 Tax=Humibacillus sp. DSM 29435 TaxID=1869167 RepID=UPI000872BD02|nr:MerR family transcriptional regulator [Humibacillus sp. DSM 29435]OFE17846.1 transcriptional regulator [Humibacillus sp. DSM 29435]